MWCVSNRYALFVVIFVLIYYKNIHQETWFNDIPTFLINQTLQFHIRKTSVALSTYLKVARSTENHKPRSFRSITSAWVFIRQWVQEWHGRRVICGKFYVGASVTATRWCYLQQFHWHWTICMQKHQPKLTQSRASNDLNFFNS